MRATVRVPASVANVGPGFDMLAVALQLQNEVSAETTDDGAVSIDLDSEDDDEQLRDPAHNLVARAYVESCARLHVPQHDRGVRLRCVNTIPVARGLGSSAAATLSTSRARSTVTARCWSIASPIESLVNAVAKSIAP